MGTTTLTQDQTVRGFSMSDIHIVREYPHAPAKVWRALTDPALMALWTMRPEGFAPVVGTRFKLIAKPQPGWRGFVECEVLEVREGELIRYSWVGNDGQQAMEVSYRLERTSGGTRLVFDQTGFRGIRGYLLSKLMMGPGWRKMLAVAIPAVLADMDEDGQLRPQSALRPMFPG